MWWRLCRCSGDLLYKRIFLIELSNMDRDKMAEKILHLTLEILFRLTGQDYIVLKKTSSERCQAPVSEGWRRTLIPITGPPPHAQIHGDINDQKILELTYKMIELLTGEVPIRCQDVTVYFSMEEWEYLEGHKDLYKDVMMEVPQPFTSPVLSSKMTTPEICPRPLLPQDYQQQNSNVPQDHQNKDLTHINTTETYVRGDERCKEKTPTYDHPDDCTRRSEGKLKSSIDLEINQDITKVNATIPDMSSSFHSKDLSPDPFKSPKRSVKYPTVTHPKIYIEEERFSSSECGKYFNQKSELVSQKRVHAGEKPYTCSECGNCYASKTNLVTHQRIHTGEKPFACSECGRRFGDKSNFFRHQRTHTGEMPYSCSECGKCFTNKRSLTRHQISHKVKSHSHT
ncbi:uncharacterized protein [Phyllobates terribilis]|uniref:uncharacterized protein n=1 Tax=Phyllobates terribilis TaxID=111132 RepID=UPI003CCB26A9